MEDFNKVTEEINSYEMLITNYEMLVPNVKAFYNEIRNLDTSIEHIKKTLSSLKEPNASIDSEELEKVKSSIAYLYQFYVLRVQDTKSGFEAFRERIASFVEFISKFDTSTDSSNKEANSSMSDAKMNQPVMNSASSSPIPTFA